MTLPVDSKGAAIDKVLTEMVEDTVMIITKDLPSLLQHEETYRIRRHHKNEILKNIPEAKQAILAILAQEVKRVRLEWFKAGQEDIINHYHHDPEIRRAVKAATLKARKAGLV